MDMEKMKANPDALTGIWVTLDGFEDFRVQIKSLECPEADLYQQKLTKKILGVKARKSTILPPRVRDYVFCKTLIEVCIVDWKNWVENGQQISFNREKLADFLLMDAPNGIQVGKRLLMTPDEKAYNFEGKLLYTELLKAAGGAGSPDDDDDDDDDIDGDPVKNGSKPGCGNDMDSVTD